MKKSYIGIMLGLILIPALTVSAQIIDFIEPEIEPIATSTPTKMILSLGIAQPEIIAVDTKNNSITAFLDKGNNVICYSFRNNLACTKL